MLPERLKARAAGVRRDVAALHLAFRDRRVPLAAKLVILCVVAYALSPIDLIPDAIPIVGYLDDLILLPLGVALALRLIPDPVLQDCRRRAQRFRAEDRSLRLVGLGLVVAVWTGLGFLLVGALVRVLR